MMPPTMRSEVNARRRVDKLTGCAGNWFANPLLSSALIEANVCRTTRDDIETILLLYVLYMS